jgi:hypothetical protein
MENASLADQTVKTLDAYFRNGALLFGLRDQIIMAFNEDELKDLALFLGINYDALSGSGTGSKAREIVTLCARQKRLAELLAQCAELRPNTEWPDTKELASTIDAQQLDQAGKLNTVLEQRFSGDPYAAETLSRLAEQPETSSRKMALSNLLEELLEDDPAFADSLRNVMEAKSTSQDIIQQEVSLSDRATAGDITVIGKIDGNANLNPSKEKKSWWRRLFNE